MPDSLVVAFCAALVLAGCADGSDVNDEGGATILDGTGGPAIDDGVLLFSSDTIECVGSRANCPAPDGAEIHEVISW